MSIINLDKIEQIMGVDIESIGFPHDTTACLKRENIKTVGDLLRMDYDKLEYMDSVGLLSIENIKECLNAFTEKNDSARIEELLNTSILELEVNNKTYYALRFAHLDTIGQILSHDKESLKKVSKRINDVMLDDIEESIKLFAKEHDCMEEMSAFPFFDECTDEGETETDPDDVKQDNDSDPKETVAKCVEAVLVKRSLQKRPWITASAIMEALGKEYPEIIETATAGMVREILISADWAEKDDFYYRYKDIPDESKSAVQEETEHSQAVQVSAGPKEVSNEIEAARIDSAENQPEENIENEPASQSDPVKPENLPTETEISEDTRQNGESIDLLRDYRSSYDPLDSHRRDLTVGFKTYHALRLSNLETVRDIISIDRETLKRDYPRIDDDMIEDISKAVLRLASNYDYEEETKQYPFFSSDERKPEGAEEYNGEYNTETIMETEDEELSEISSDNIEPFTEIVEDEPAEVPDIDIEAKAEEKEESYSEEEQILESQDALVAEEEQESAAIESEPDLCDDSPAQEDISALYPEEKSDIFEEAAEEEPGEKCENETEAATNETEEVIEQPKSGPSDHGLLQVDESTFEIIKDLPIDNLGLSNRARNCLLRAKLSTVGMVLEKPRDELAMIQNMGQGSLDDITTCIARLISGDTAYEQGRIPEKASVAVDKKILDADDERFDNISIDELNLSVRAFNCLRNGGIETIGQLNNCTEADILAIRGMGRGSLNEIVSAVQAYVEKPTFKHTSVEEGGSFGDDFYSSKEFSNLVDKKVRDMFVSAEKNSMSFFDIWSDLGMTIPEPVVTREVERLVEQGVLSFSDDAYKYEFISILDAIKVLPTKYQNILLLKLQGLKYEEIAGRYGVTRSRVQQLAAKGMTAVIKGTKGIPAAGRVKEDDDKELFQTYNISLGEWVTELRKPEHAYRYLAMRYRRGEAKLPGVRQTDPYKAPRATRTKAEVEAATIDDFLDYYKSLAGAQKAVLLYSDEEQYKKDINRLSKRINREIKRKKYISDIRITDHEYAMLRGYLHYAVKLLNKIGAAPDDAVFATAVTNVAERVYDGNLWGNFFKEIGIKQTQTLQSNIGTKYVEILERLGLLKDEDGRFFQSVLMHCFVSDNFANSYFDFLFNFYRIDLDRDLDRLDRDTMRALMDSICAEENVGRTYMLVQHIGQAMAANRRGATLRIRNHMKLLDKFFWDDSFEINTTHRLNNLMQKWARSSKEVIGEMEAFSTGRARGRKRFATPYIAYDEANRSCVLAIPAQSIKRFDAEEIYWKVSGSINEELDVELAESVIGYKVLESRWEIPMETALDAMQLELMTSEGEVIKKFQIRSTDVRFFDSEGYPINSKSIKVGEVLSISRENSPVKSSALYETQVIDGMLLSSFHFEFEDILHLPNGHVVIVGKPDITNSIAGKGRIEGAVCRFDDRDYDLYGKMPYLVLRMKSEKFPGTAVTINGKRHRLSDLDYESFSLDDRTGDNGYYIDLNNYLEHKNDVYRIAVDIPGGSAPHWEFVYIEGFEADFDEAPYVFEPRGTVAFPDHITIKKIEEGCEREPGINGYKFIINEVGRTLDFVTGIGEKDVDISIPVPAFFIKDDNGDWDSDMPAPVWHADLPDVLDLAVPHHKITLYMDDVFTESGDSERKIEYRRNLGDDHILCDISKFKSYLSGDDFARQLRMRFGETDTNLLTIIIHSKVVSLQIIGNFETNELAVNADISGKATYYVDIRRGDETIAEKMPLIDGTARINHEIANGVYDVEVFELVEDESGFGGEDYYSIGVYNQEMINPYDMTGRSFRIIQIEEKDDPLNVLPLRLRFSVLDLKGTDDKHIYSGMMLVKKSFYQGSELAALPVSVRFDDLNRPNYAWVSFIDEEYGEETDFLYDTRKQGILQEENPMLKSLVCYRRYTFLNDEEYIYHIDFTEEHYKKEYDELNELIEYPESETKIVFKNHKYDSKRKRYETSERSGRGNIHFSSSIVFVGDAPLSPKSKMCLRDARINTLNELTKLTKADLVSRSSIATVKVIREIDSALAQYGMKFKDMEDDK